MIRYMMYVDGVKFYDTAIEELALINPVLELEDNNAGTLKFTVPPGHPYADRFKPLTSTIEVYQDSYSDEGWLFSGRIVLPERTYNDCVSYECEGALAFLNSSVVRQRYFQNVTPQGYIQALLDNHNEQVEENRRIYLGAITVTDPNDAITCYWNYNPSFLEFKEDIIDDLGGHARIRKRDGRLYLDVLAEYGVTSTQTIEFGENLIDLTEGFDFSQIVTGVIPLGAKLESETEEQVGTLDGYITIADVNGGHDYLINEEMRKEFGLLMVPIEFSDVHVPSLLKSKAEKYLKDVQFDCMEINAKALDLHYTNEEMAGFKIGDRIRVISRPHKIDKYFPVTRLEIHMDYVADNTITLGGQGEPVSISGTANKVSITTGKLKEEIKEPNKLIDEAVKRATELINQGLSGHVIVNGNEILIMDTDDPETAKYVWRWNMGGLGFSNSGYNGPFETAITMDGTIVGKFIAANSIAADQIDVNYRKEVYDSIDMAQELAQAYTDTELGSYYTKRQVDTQLKTTSDSILLSAEQKAQLYVDGKLSGNYYTKSQIDVKLDEINSTVTKKFNNYSTTTEMNSAISQKANEITRSVSETYATKTSYNNLKTTVNSVEEKVTSSGIFTTINSGLKGSYSFKTTKYTLDKNGITIQNGGFTIKNNSGEEVFNADARGNLYMRGRFACTRSDTSTEISIKMEYDTIKFYHGGQQAGVIACNTSSGSKRYLDLIGMPGGEIRIGYPWDDQMQESGDYWALGDEVIQITEDRIAFFSDDIYFKGGYTGTIRSPYVPVYKNGLVVGKQLE